MDKYYGQLFSVSVLQCSCNTLLMSGYDIHIKLLEGPVKLGPHLQHM